MFSWRLVAADRHTSDRESTATEAGSRLPQRSRVDCHSVRASTATAADRGRRANGFRFITARATAAVCLRAVWFCSIIKRDRTDLDMSFKKCDSAFRGMNPSIHFVNLQTMVVKKARRQTTSTAINKNQSQNVLHL